MFSRKVRGLLPIQVDPEKEKENLKIKNELINRQMIQKEYYDRNAHGELKPLKVTDKVFVRKELHKPLVPAEITKICDGPRSYDVELSNKRRIEWNRKHLFGPISRDNEEKKEVANDIIDSQSNGVALADEARPEISNNTSSFETETSDNTQPRSSGRTLRIPKYLNDYVRR